MACPSDVKIGDLIVRARNNHLAQSKKPLMNKLRDAILSNTDVMGKINTPLAPIVNTITGLKATRFMLEKTLISVRNVLYLNMRLVRSVAGI